MYFFYLSSCLAWLVGNFVRLTWSCPGCSKLEHNWADNSQLRQLQSNIFNTRSLGGRKIWFFDVELNLIWHTMISCHCLALIQMGEYVQKWNMAFFRKLRRMDRGQGQVVSCPTRKNLVGGGDPLQVDVNHSGRCYGLEWPIELIFLPKLPSQHKYLITIFFPAHFVHVWGAKTAIF